jgi:hypothetical protein
MARTFRQHAHTAARIEITGWRDQREGAAAMARPSSALSVDARDGCVCRFGPYVAYFAFAVVLSCTTLLGPPRSGTWTCFVCGAIEDRLVSCGLVLRRSEAPDHEREDTTRYSRWIEGVGGVAHEHAWSPTGCHDRAGGLACHLGLSSFAFYRAMPEHPDTGLALTLVERLAGTFEPERQELLKQFQLDPPVLEAMASCAELLAAHDAWLARHPLWLSNRCGGAG